MLSGAPVVDEQPYEVQFVHDDWSVPTQLPPTYIGFRGSVTQAWRVPGVLGWYRDDEILAWCPA
jgi:hypothetical protein